MGIKVDVIFDIILTRTRVHIYRLARGQGE